MRKSEKEKNKKRLKKKILLYTIAILIAGIFALFGSRLLNTEKSVVLENNKTEQKVDSTVKVDEPENAESETSEEETETEVEQVEGENTNEEKTANSANEETESVDSSIEIEKRLVSWGFSFPKKTREIDTIIIHSSYDALHDDPYGLEGLIAEYKLYGVAPHFLIDREGKIYQLVENKNIAYHAGESKVSDGRTGVNNFSIGIEIMNTKTDEYTEEQYENLKDLLEYLKNKYEIKYILGHDEIAPERKSDPWNFDWKKIGIEK